MQGWGKQNIVHFVPLPQYMSVNNKFVLSVRTRNGNGMGTAFVPFQKELP